MKILFTKRLSIIGSILLATTFMACEKDQADTNTLRSSETDTEMSISGSAASGEINGLITESAADRMKSNFNKTFTTGKKTESITFSVKDLSNYLAQLKTKFKSDSVSVSFGVYDETTAVKKKDIGRITVFFKGNGKKSKNGNIGGQEDEPSAPGKYLNHGALFP
ncbi:MAG: hypothetical protein EAZ35_09305 [Sphingobacteriia bacterium]|nr:MAG: hypothetical protein EAZ41_01685 [Sphingobacteriia bacterium]TAG29812.1 MAG: hypothetical protein EAZ35_09305 [Sphingobacteriia bacterium]